MSARPNAARTARSWVFADRVAFPSPFMYVHESYCCLADELQWLIGDKALNAVLAVCGIEMTAPIGLVAISMRRGTGESYAATSGDRDCAIDE